MSEDYTARVLRAAVEVAAVAGVANDPIQVVQIATWLTEANSKIVGEDGVGFAGPLVLCRNPRQSHPRILVDVSFIKDPDSMQWRP